MLKNKITIVLKSIALSALVACTAKTSYLMPPPAELEVVTRSANGMKIEYNPLVDILFVLDNSHSMEESLTTLKQNISEFVSEISKNEIVDYRIGVTFVHDSIKYTNTYETTFKYHPETGEKIYNDLGELVRTSKMDNDYITKNDINELNDLFNINVYPFVNNKLKAGSTTEYETVSRGPVYEESFSPIRAILNKTNNFLRPTSHLVIFFVTDAEDSSKDSDGTDYEAKELFRDVYNIRGGDMSRISAYGVLCKTGERECLNITESGNTIEQDSLKIKEFIKLVRNEKIHQDLIDDNEIYPILNLQSSQWGKTLATVGADIRKKTMEKVIPLGNTFPEFDKNTSKPMIKVTYDEQEIAYDSEKGWTYNANRNTITVHSGLNIEHFSKDARVEVSFQSVKNGPYFKELK